jgi:predicted nuclease with RNAse H fold
MRVCEKILKKRGVNVYPALIPSMQKLTYRGMILANYFRQIGIPVIESYPGAAQDIMGIPRKRAGVEYLERGMRLFGINGSFDYNRVTHDELDAITSAIVGLFFWSGKFEAIGSDYEDYLIIPDLLINEKSWTNRFVVGFNGNSILDEKILHELSDVLKCKYMNINELILKYSKGEIIEGNVLSYTSSTDFKGRYEVLKRIRRELQMGGNLILDGVEYLEDIAFIKETVGPAFYYCFIDNNNAVNNTEMSFNSAYTVDVRCVDEGGRCSKLKKFADVVMTSDVTIDMLVREIMRILGFNNI